MNIFDQYLDNLKKILLDLSKQGEIILPDKLDGINAEIPPEKFNCDISTNVAMVLSKINKKFQDLSNSEEFLLCITENGYGKLSSAYEYRITNRGGSGVTNITVTPKNGRVVQSLKVSADDNIALISDNGKLLRCNVGENIRVVGRVSQGVSVFKVDKNEKIVSVARLEESGDDE